ncbi:MAG: hypothetical protein U0271_47130 [Polyangiaceae bacterium]
MRPTSLLLSTLLAMSFACGDSGSGGAGGGGGQSAAYAGTKCEQCDKTACASERDACAADASCAGYLTCLSKCGLADNQDAEPSCEADCAAAHGTSAALLDAFRTCRAGADCSASADTQCDRAAVGGGGGAGGAALCESPAYLDQTCPASTEPDACFKCNYEKCCDSVDEIFGTGPAADLTQCWLQCASGDSACEKACFDQYPDGVDGFGKWWACSNVQCGEPDGPCTVSNQCNQCQYDSCECEYAACEGEPECFLAFYCFSICDDTACLESCQAEHPTGLEAMNSLIVCVSQRCGSVCGMP